MDFTQLKLDDLFACLGEQGAVGLAVSGGGDSMALMHLFAEWRKVHPLKSGRDVVFSVDHGLRKEAAGEVALVISSAEALGFIGAPIKLEGLGEGGSLQARAREARYEAMAGRLKELGLSQLLTAHTLDDQAETFLMRLLRGSGIDGLSAMFEKRELYGIKILRPLLSVRGEVLREWLRARGVEWVTDPSNENEDYERVQVRHVLRSLEGILDGFGNSPKRDLTQMIGESASRLQRGRLALEEQALDFVVSHVTAHRVGLLYVKAVDLFNLSEEIQIRVLRRLLMAFGVEGRALSSLEGAAAHIKTMREEKFVFAGVMCEKKADGYLQFSRESGRSPFEIVKRDFTKTDISQDSQSQDNQAKLVHQLIWDNRIEISVPKDFSGNMVVRGFSNVEIAKVKEKYKQIGTDVARLNGAQRVLPALAGCWSNDQLVAVPQLELYDESLFIELFGDLDAFLDGTTFERAVFPLNRWKTQII